MLGNDIEFPSHPPTASFAGPIDTSLKLAVSNIGLSAEELKCCGFVKLSTFFSGSRENRTPFRRSYPFHVFVFFPIQLKPYDTLCQWMLKTPKGPFAAKQWFYCTGRIMGILPSSSIENPPPDGCTILVIVPENFRFISSSMVGGMQPLPTASQPVTPEKRKRLSAFSFLMKSQE